MEVPVLNDTPLVAEVLGLDPASPILTILVKGTFDLVPDGPVRLAPEQRPLTGADEHTGDAEVSAVRYESDFVPFKPRADALCVGTAHPPGGGPVTECQVRFGVGGWTKVIRVVGDRFWRPRLGRLHATATRPAPFTALPVTFDNAYGGVDAGRPDGNRFFERNRVGKGYTRRGGGLADLPLPNLESRSRPVRRWNQRPDPKAYGPAGRTWRPRASLAGTYDKKWLAERSPQLPRDFDPGFYNCAPADQQIRGFLRGDEELRLENLDPELPRLVTRLPGWRIRAHRTVPDLVEVPLNLDTLWVDADARQLVLVWRGRLPAEELPQGEAILVGAETGEALPPDHWRERAAVLRAEDEDDGEEEAREAERELAARDAEITADNDVPPAD